ncbi:MAG: glycosyltransferase [Anaerolineales bacterium]|nr:glycosyltransferase [Anaerolineales bacterium]MCB8939320.1 glycosyltransferase [Ardenticatenaceae bacterium]
MAFVPPEDEVGLEGMQQLCQKVVGIAYQPHALVPRLRRAWHRFWQPKVYGRNHSRQYVLALKKLVAAGSFDVAVVDGMMAEYGRYLNPIPAVLDEVDIFSTVAHQYFRDESRWLPKMWNGFDWLRTTVRETTHLQQFAGIFVRSAKDEQLIREFAPQQKIAILPPWFEGLAELTAIPINRSETPRLLFVGAMNIPANITAVTFFVEKVFPLITSQRPDVQFDIVGSRPTAAVQALGKLPNVQVTGDVPSLTPYYAKADMVVVPLFTGGGIIVKTLNGLASGRPVMTTIIGNSGTGARDGRDLRIVSAQPEGMATAILEVLADDGEWLRLAENGRKFIQTHYDWSQTTANMVQFLQSVSQQRT